MNDSFWLIVLGDVVIVVYTLVRYAQFRKANRGVRLNFRLIELWAITLSLCPALALFGYLSRQPDPRMTAMAPLVLALFVPHNTASAFLTILRNHEDPTSQRIAAEQPSSDQFVYMLISSLFGYMLPLFTIGGPALIFLLVVVWVVTLPFSLIPAGYLLHKYNESRVRRKYHEQRISDKTMTPKSDSSSDTRQD